MKRALYTVKADVMYQGGLWSRETLFVTATSEEQAIRKVRTFLFFQNRTVRGIGPVVISVLERLSDRIL